MERVLTVLRESWSMSGCGFWIISRAPEGLPYVHPVERGEAMTKTGGLFRFGRAGSDTSMDSEKSALGNYRIDQNGDGSLLHRWFVLIAKTELHHAAMNLVGILIRPLARVRKSATALRYL